MSTQPVRLVLFSFAMLVLIMESALALYWRELLAPRLLQEAHAQAEVLAQAQAPALARALAIADPATRDLRLEEVLDGILLLRDPVREDPYFQAIQLTLDGDQFASSPGGLIRIVGQERADAFVSEVALFDPASMVLLGAARFHVSAGFHRALAEDLSGQLIGQGVFIAGLLTVLGSALALLLRQLDRQQQARLAAERALAANERRMRHLIDNLDNYFVYARNADGKMDWVSHSVERVLGVSREQFLTERRSFLTDNPINQESLSRLDRPVRRGSESFEFEMRDAQGIVRRIECTEVVSNVDGSTDGLARDVTAQRQFEAELRTARETAESANTAKSQFLANMSHEIRTPMNAVIGMATLLGKSTLSSRQREQLAKLESSARLLLGILDDILDLSRIEAGKLRIMRREFALDELLTDLTTLVGQRAREKRLDLLIDCDSEVPRRLVGDSMRVLQVLVNLVINAIKFTDHGEVVVRVELVEADAHSHLLRFDVRDTGKGIPPDALPRLFEQFTQMDESSTRQHGGAGLGLAISRRLARLMGGELEAESTPGRGSRFWFTARFTRAAEPVPTVPTLPRPGLRVLVVDDSAAAREVFGNLLGSLRFDVCMVDSAEAAMPLLIGTESRFDLLLIDHDLPGRSGLDTVRQLHVEGLCPACVMVSAVEDAALPGLAERAGVDVFLPKPVSPSALYDAALQALHRHGGSTLSSAMLRPQAPSRFAAGCRVLLAEDNEINRQVAGELLRGMGLEVQIAVNGRDAVELASRERFDLVLMDVQMPQMDGLEATARLKGDPGTRGLPVVALTAHAMASDRERFLEAGMDDYLAKPIEERDLLRVLARWLPVADGSDELPKVSAARHAAPPIPIVPGIDTAAALSRVNGKQALLWRLIRDFRERYRETPGQLRDWLAQNLGDAAARHLHTLRGSAATLGIEAVTQAAGSAERALRNKDDRALGDALTDLAQALSELQLLELPGEEPTPTLTTTNPLEESRAALADLAKAIDERRLDAARGLARLSESLPERTELAAALDALDYIAARAVLDRVMRQFEQRET
jgi:signal transduction histidine kinase/DNA-binding response OmpR family regulator/HPt (histidine-containing phosphotransfer) domain-containing protein